MGLADVLSPVQVPRQGTPLGCVALGVQSCSQSSSSAIPPPEVPRGGGFLNHYGGSHGASAGLFPQQAGGWGDSQGDPHSLKQVEALVMLPMGDTGDLGVLLSDATLFLL